MCARGWGGVGVGVRVTYFYKHEINILALESFKTDELLLKESIYSSRRRIFSIKNKPNEMGGKYFPVRVVSLGYVYMYPFPLINTTNLNYNEWQSKQKKKAKKKKKKNKQKKNNKKKNKKKKKNRNDMEINACIQHIIKSGNKIHVKRLNSQ